MKTFLILMSISFFCFTGIKEETFKDQTFGFSISMPEKWNRVYNEEIRENLNKYKLEDEELQTFIKNHNSSILLVSFMKYNPNTHRGLIPTIQVNVRNNETQSFEHFFSVMKSSGESFKNYFHDFTFIDQPQEVEVDGIRSVFFTGTFTMKSKGGTEVTVRSRTYAIPKGKYFFQVNFTDGGTEDSSDLFDHLVQTIKIDK